MPNGETSTVFWLRPDQELSILQVGRQVNKDRFAKPYEDLRRSAVGINAPVQLESLNDHDSYFKFNLDAISIYNLLRLEEESSRRSDYIVMYRTFHSAIANHGNAFFNVIDRALIGPNTTRDAETIRLMAQWLARPRRDFYVDLRGSTRHAEMIARATLYLSQSAFGPIFSGSVVLICSTEADPAVLRHPRSTSSFPIGWAATMAWTFRH